MGTRKKSLILITVDCLRADHCGFNGYDRPTTPFLDALATESYVLPTAVIAGAPTYYSFPAIFASRMPLGLGRDVIGLAPGENTLTTVLRRAGYATAAFCAANPYISPRFGYEQGFEHFEDFLGPEFCMKGDPEPESRDRKRRAKQLAEGGPPDSGLRSAINRISRRGARAVGLGPVYDELYFQYCIRLASPPVDRMEDLRKFPSAEVIVDHALAWLTSATEAFFLWLHFMDPHSPYYPPAVAFQQLTGRDASASAARYLNESWNRSDLNVARLRRKKHRVVELYDAGIRAVDIQIARLVEGLKRSHLWDNCVLGVTADHGEEFLEHGRRYHAPVSVHEEIARVPLMIRVPGVAKRNVPASPFSHLHLAPTLLEILEMPIPDSFRGKSLWRNLREGMAWEDMAITECVFGCNNPFRATDRSGPRLLSVRDERHKLVMRVERSATEQLYDLECDPAEEKPHAVGAERPIGERLLQAAVTHIQRGISGRDAALRLKARLRELRIELRSGSL